MGILYRRYILSFYCLSRVFAAAATTFRNPLRAAQTVALSCDITSPRHRYTTTGALALGAAVGTAPAALLCHAYASEPCGSWRRRCTYDGRGTSPKATNAQRQLLLVYSWHSHPRQRAASEANTLTDPCLAARIKSGKDSGSVQQRFGSTFSSVSTYRKNRKAGSLLDSMAYSKIARPSPLVETC